MTDDKNAVSADNRAVSPVIGVILMVAITVILAAVIGTFVLGLGGDLQQAPQAQISIEAAGAGNTGFVISHNGGDSIPAQDMVVTYDTTSTNFENTNFGTGEFSVGDSVTVSPGGGEVTVQLIHEPSDSIIAEATVDT